MEGPTPSPSIGFLCYISRVMEKKTIDVSPKEIYADGKAGGYLLSALNQFCPDLAPNVSYLFVGYSLLDQDLYGALFDLAMISLSSLVLKRQLLIGQDETKLPEWGDFPPDPNQEKFLKLSEVLIGSLTVNLANKKGMDLIDCFGPAQAMAGALYEGIRDGYNEDSEDKKQALAHFKDIYLSSPDKQSHFIEITKGLERILLETSFRSAA